ncbi:MAG: monovalent cation/H+ antiporter complex subunit F [Candidatus Dormibacteraceae bacterium]
MNEWLLAATVLLISLVPLLWLAFRSNPGDALVVLEMATVVIVLVMALIAEGFGRAPFMDLAVVLAILSLGGAFTFARFLERWV